MTFESGNGPTPDNHGEQPASRDAGTPPDPGRSLAAPMEQVTAFLGRFEQAARADACLGAPQSAGGHTAIPVASVSLQAGFGMGIGGGGGGDGASQGQGIGGGAGGGGRAASRVVAVLDVSDRGVRVQPVPDVTSLALALFALVGVVFVARGRGGRGMLRALRSQQP